jgi:xylulokinase
MRQEGIAMKACVLVVDVGTSKVRTNLIDLADGTLLLSEAKSFKWIHPKEGWSESDVNSEWEAAQDVLEVVLEKSKGKYDIKALAFSQIGAGILFMDKDGNPLGNMILAMDVRAVEEGRMLQEEFKDDEKSVFRSSNFSASLPPAKVLWLKRNKPEFFDRAVLIGNIQQFFNQKLGLGPINDPVLAGITGFFDAYSHDFNYRLCDFIGFSTDRLGPQPIFADSILGEIDKFGRVDLGQKLPVILGTHDCTSGMIGVGSIPSSDSIIANITGTYDHICFIADSMEGALVPLSGPIEGSFVVMNGAVVSGPNLDWFVKAFYPDQGVAAITPLFEQNTFDGSNKVFLVRDINCGDGIFRGLNLTSTSGDMFKAVIEGLTFPLVGPVEASVAMRGANPRIRIGGGSARSDKWSQLRADIFGVPVEKVANIEVSSVGAAVFAAVALGYYPDYSTATERMVRIEQVFEPNLEINQRYKERYTEYLELV